MLRCALVSVVNFLRIKAAALQAENLVVAPVGHQRCRLRILAEELLAHVRAIFGFESLIFAVHALFHTFEQHAGVVAGQQFIPAGAPDDLDYVPAGAAEGCFQLIDDLSVAAHGPIKPLQVAINYKNQVVELLTRSQCQLRAQHLWFIGFTIAHKGPDFARSRLD